MKNLLIVLIIICTQGVLQLHGQATANSDGNWSDSRNWTSNNIGDGGESVTIGANVDIVINDGESYTISALSLNKQGSLTINAGGLLTINGLLSADKEFSFVIAGTLVLNGNMSVAKELSLDVTGDMIIDGSVNMAKDAVLVIDGSLDVTGNFTSTQNASVTVNGDMSVGGDLGLGAGSEILGTGPVVTTTCSGTACGDSQLPVTLVEYEVYTRENAVVIAWSTLTEQENDFFTLERSFDGINFEVAGLVNGNGNSNRKISYEFQDTSPLPGISYYRLSQTDFDGTTEIFKTKVVEFSGQAGLQVYPNPVSAGGVLKVATPGFGNNPATLRLVSMAGKTVYAYSGNNLPSDIVLDRNLPKGMYVLTVIQGAYTETVRISVVK